MNDLTQIEETSQEVLTEVSQQPTKKKRNGDEGIWLNLFKVWQMD